MGSGPHPVPGSASNPVFVSISAFTSAPGPAEFVFVGSVSVFVSVSDSDFGPAPASAESVLVGSASVPVSVSVLIRYPASAFHSGFRFLNCYPMYVSQLGIAASLQPTNRMLCEWDKIPALLP
jgi:hypothetical protein